MTRPLETRDSEALEHLKQHAKGDFQWAQGPDFIEGVAFVDREDSPKLVAGAWARAEVHCLIDPNWGTPEQKLEAFKLLHAEMERELAARGVRQVVTWFSPAEMLRAGGRAFLRRLQDLGWIRSENTSWHRKVEGNDNV